MQSEQSAIFANRTEIISDECDKNRKNFSWMGDK